MLTGLALLLILASSARVAMAQEATPQLLDGMEIEYMYSDGGTVVVNFGNGRLSYRWTAGPFAGTAVAERIYQSRQIGDDLYMVSWHDEENLNFATLVFDFEQDREYGSALVSYGTDQSVVLFDEAVIRRATGRPSSGQ
jgi:hypothetical protein